MPIPDPVTRDLWLNAPAYPIHLNALREALVTVLTEDTCAGVQLQGDGRISAQMQPDVPIDDPADVAAQMVLDAHDPVSLSVDRTVILADGAQAATVTVTAPRPDAAPVVLLVVVNDAAPTEWAIAITDGVGADTITALDPCTITVTLKTPANRSADSLSIMAR